MSSVHAFVSKNDTDQNILGRYVDRFHQDEHNKMNPNYVRTSVARSSVTEIGCL